VTGSGNTLAAAPDDATYNIAVFVGAGNFVCDAGPAEGVSVLEAWIEVARPMAADNAIVEEAWVEVAYQNATFAVVEEAWIEYAWSGVIGGKIPLPILTSGQVSYL
jgi:hypothetical protein